MSPLTTLGSKTQTIFLKGIENHKLHHEFEVAEGETISKGQPVYLNTDGEVCAAKKAGEGGEGDPATPANAIIGWSIHNGSEGEVVTVGMKAFGIVWAMPNAALNAGPVEYDGMNDEDPTFNSFVVATGANTTIGWALDKASAADELIRVAIY